MSARVAIVLAAGKGTRMKSDVPKVLVPVAGRPMVEYVLDALDAAGIDRTVLVVGYRSDLVRETLAHRQRVTFAEQAEQLGTGHAVMMAAGALAEHEGAALVVTGDSPMIQVSSIKKLLAEYDNGQPACVLGTAFKDNPAGLGRIVRDAAGEFLGIVEQKDATPEQQAIREVNMSTYVFHAPDLLVALKSLGNNNAQREYYITDCPAILRGLGREVRARAVLEPVESLSINTPDELKVVEQVILDGPQGKAGSQAR